MQPVYLISQTNALIYLCLIVLVCVVVYAIGKETGRRQERKQHSAPTQV